MDDKGSPLQVAFSDLENLKGRSGIFQKKNGQEIVGQIVSYDRTLPGLLTYYVMVKGQAQPHAVPGVEIERLSLVVEEPITRDEFFYRLGLEFGNVPVQADERDLSHIFPVSEKALQLLSRPHGLRGAVLLDGPEYFGQPRMIRGKLGGIVEVVSGRDPSYELLLAEFDEGGAVRHHRVPVRRIKAFGVRGLPVESQDMNKHYGVILLKAVDRLRHSVATRFSVMIVAMENIEKVPLHLRPGLPEAVANLVQATTQALKEDPVIQSTRLRLPGLVQRLLFDRRFSLGQRDHLEVGQPLAVSTESILTVLRIESALLDESDPKAARREVAHALKNDPYFFYLSEGAQSEMVDTLLKVVGEQQAAGGYSWEALLNFLGGFKRLARPKVEIRFLQALDGLKELNPEP